MAPIVHKNDPSKAYFESLANGTYVPPTHAQLHPKPRKPYTFRDKTPKKTIEPGELPKLELPTEDPGFIQFCRWAAFPKYGGLYKWQKECYEEIKDAKVSEIKVPRDHGKSIFLGDYMQYLIQYCNTDVLYMGWTDRRKEVAVNVCNFFELYDEINNKKSDYHFTTKNGGKFDCYLITSKDVLGLHSVGDQGRFNNLNPEEKKDFKEFYKDLDDKELKMFLDERNLDRQLAIIIDDPIDDTFMDERHKEHDLETRFASTIYNINPDIWVFVGTKKFEEDFFYFVEQMFKHQIIVFCRKTHLQKGEVRYDAEPETNPLNLLSPERFTEIGMPEYEDDRTPRHKGGKGKRDLKEIYNALMNAGKIYWWYAEYEQEPHPIAGTVWRKVGYSEIEVPLHKHYDVHFAYVDRATKTVNMKRKEPADTGCLLGYREFKTGDRLITDDWTDIIPLEKLLFDLTTHFDLLHRQHPRIVLLLVVEQQGGGDDLEAMYYTRTYFEWDGERVDNTLKNITKLVMVHSTGEKLERIRYRLYAPISNNTIKFVKVLRLSLVVQQILTFPNCAKFDAIDCLATGDFKVLQMPVIKGGNPYGGVAEAFRDYGKQKQKLDEKDLIFEPVVNSELEGIKNKIKERRKGVFG